MSSSFRVDPNDYLSNNYNDFKTEVYALALSKPATYFEIRKNVVQKVKRDAVKNIYDTFYAILKDGTVDGAPLIKNTAGNVIRPSYPEQLINEECLGCAKTLDNMCEHIVDIILPREINAILSDRLGKSGKESIV